MYRELISELTKDSSLTKIQPPCPESMIDTAEKAVGYSFPKELRDLLGELNGDNYFLLSAEEIIKQAELNRELQAEYGGEEFAKELDKLIFFATNGCGDYFCYHADSDGVIDESSIYVWEHEEYCLKQAATNMTELITKYYKDEI